MMRREPDPRHEMFDVLTEQGEPTGEVRSRAEVHRRGLWHRSFHCWLVWLDDSGEPVILFQRRSPNKDTAGGMLDVAVGGHYRAGEDPAEVYREIEEELGLAVDPDDLAFVGVRFATGFGPGYVDREVQDVHVHVLRHHIERARPSIEEITALESVTLTNLEGLFGGERPEIPCVRHPVAADNRLLAPETGHIRREDFLPVRDDYWRRGARVAVDVLSGVPNPTLRLAN